MSVGRFPPPDITAAEFERFVADLLKAGEKELRGFAVALHERVVGVDGTFDFDATVRFRLLGMDYLVVVEAKRHAYSIKRELVQVLQSKAHGVGAQKAVLISTAPFQRGAIAFAKIYGVALVTVTEGRFTFETRSALQPPLLSREQAADLYGIPAFVGIYSEVGDSPGSTRTTIVDADDWRRVQELLFGIKPDGSSG